MRRLFHPAVHVSQGFIHNLLHGSVGTVALSHEQALASALLRKVMAARVRHPDLNGTKSRRAHGIAVLLNPLIDVRRCQSPSLESGYMQHSARSLRYMQQAF